MQSLTGLTLEIVTRLGSDNNQNDGQKFKQNVKKLDDVRNRSASTAWQTDRQTDRNGMSAACCARWRAINHIHVNLHYKLAANRGNEVTMQLWHMTWCIQKSQRSVSKCNKKLCWCGQTRATRLEVSQDHQTEQQCVRYSFLLAWNSNFVFKTNIRLQKCLDLENRVRGPSRSLEMSPFDRAHTKTSYWRSIVTMALSRVVSEIFDVKYVWHWNPGQRSLKVIESGTIR